MNFRVYTSGILHSQWNSTQRLLKFFYEIFNIRTSQFPFQIFISRKFEVLLSKYDSIFRIHSRYWKYTVVDPEAEVIDSDDDFWIDRAMFWNHYSETANNKNLMKSFLSSQQKLKGNLFIFQRIKLDLLRSNETSWDLTISIYIPKYLIIRSTLSILDIKISRINQDLNPTLHMIKK